MCSGMNALLAAVVLSLPASAEAALGAPALRLDGQAHALLLDTRLADYQWRTSPRPAFGAACFVELGPLGLGARGDLTRTTERLADLSPQVRLLRREALLRLSMLDLAGTRVVLEGSYGRTRVEFSPANVAMLGTEVALPSVEAPSGGVGLGFEHRAHSLVLGLHAEQSFLRLATAHVRDQEPVEAEIWFANQRLVLSLGWRLGL